MYTLDVPNRPGLTASVSDAWIESQTKKFLLIRRKTCHLCRPTPGGKGYNKVVRHHF